VLTVDDLEVLLRRYRPAGPPTGLHDRVLSAGRPADPRRSVREWLWPLGAAAAALVFYLLANGVQLDLLSRTESENGDREAAIAALTADFGGDDIARLQAEHVMRLSESARAEELSRPLLQPDEVTQPWLK
jgi:hypothetical protein